MIVKEKDSDMCWYYPLCEILSKILTSIFARFSDPGDRLLEFFIMETWGWTDKKKWFLVAKNAMKKFIFLWGLNGI